MKVLGYNGGVEGYLAAFGTGHDASASIVVDGQIVAAVEEERAGADQLVELDELAVADHDPVLALEGAQDPLEEVEHLVQRAARGVAWRQQRDKRAKPRTDGRT